MSSKEAAAKPRSANTSSAASSSRRRVSSLSSVRRDVWARVRGIDGDHTPTYVSYMSACEFARRLAATPAVDALEGRIGSIIEQRLDELVGRGRMEFMEDFAYPIPALAICELIGAPLDDHHLISTHAPAIATRLDPSPMRNATTELAADA